MFLTIINLDILALMCFMMIIIIAVIDETENLIIKSISYVISTIILIIFKDFINRVINNNINLELYRNEFKILCFVFLFLVLFLIFKIIIKRISLKIKNKQLKIFKNKKLINILFGTVNSIFLINLIFCLLIIFTNIDDNYISVKVINVINEYLFR